MVCTSRHLEVQFLSILRSFTRTSQDWHMHPSQRNRIGRLISAPGLMPPSNGKDSSSFVVVEGHTDISLCKVSCCTRRKHAANGEVHTPELQWFSQNIPHSRYPGSQVHIKDLSALMLHESLVALDIDCLDS